MVTYGLVLKQNIEALFMFSAAQLL